MHVYMGKAQMLMIGRWVEEVHKPEKNGHFKRVKNTPRKRRLKLGSKIALFSGDARYRV